MLKTHTQLLDVAAAVPLWSCPLQGPGGEWGHVESVPLCWLLPCSTMSCRFIRVGAGVRAEQCPIVWMAHTWFLHSATDGHYATPSFWPLGRMPRPTWGCQRPLQTCKQFFGCPPWGGIAGSRGCFVAFGRNRPAIFRGDRNVVGRGSPFAGTSGSVGVFCGILSAVIRVLLGHRARQWHGEGLRLGLRGDEPPWGEGVPPRGTASTMVPELGGPGAGDTL